MRTAKRWFVLGLIGTTFLTAGAAPRGNLKIAGSTTVLPLSQMWAEAYMAKNPQVSISVTGGGTGVGLSGLLNGTCDIANASREAKAKEFAAARQRNIKLTAFRCAKDGLAIVVHPSNNIKNLTLVQLKDIYSGKVKTWDQVGGETRSEIVVVGRDSASGTYGFFQEAVLGGGAYRTDMLSQATNAAVAQTVAQSKSAIGYIGMAYAWDMSKKGKLKVVSISRNKGEPGVLPTDENVANGSYPLFRYLYMYTAGKPSGAAKDFINFCLSSEGQALVVKSGYMPIK
ncbi:MAG: phosphate ABC transporter substrate-binding protein [Armatimonadota bacterium]|nr:phosphate ABC transporter substrate-binding protein [Armatimonadota bacterium]